MLAAILVHVIDDHRLFREALLHAVQAAPGVRAGFAAGSVREFTSLVRSAGLGDSGTSPARTASVVLVSLRQPPSVVAEAVAVVTAMGFRALLISDACGRMELLAAWAAGCRGCVDGGAGLAELRRAIRQVSAGLRYLSRPTEADDRPPPTVDPLSNREREVLALVASGERDRDIADRLSVSVHTIRAHLDHIRRKTGHRRRAELTRFAVESGIVLHRKRDLT